MEFKSFIQFVIIFGPVVHNAKLRCLADFSKVDMTKALTECRGPKKIELRPFSVESKLRAN